MRLVIKRLAASFALIVLVTISVIGPASAISADLANKCRAMAIKAHPPTPPGAKTGSAQAERESYRACIGNNETKSDNDPQRTGAPTEK
jgi:hypothetical protein